MICLSFMPLLRAIEWGDNSLSPAQGERDVQVKIT